MPVKHILRLSPPRIAAVECIGPFPTSACERAGKCFCHRVNAMNKAGKRSGKRSILSITVYRVPKMSLT